MSNGIRLAVFDCDGTMVDSQHSIVSAMNTAFAAKGVGKPSAESVRRVIGLPLVEAIAILLPEVDSAVHHELREGYRDAYSTARKKGLINDPLFPGLVETLDIFEDMKWILGVATGKSRPGLENTLRTHDLHDRFVTLQTADVAAGKPSPDMLFRAMSETGAEPDQTVMISDTTFDMEMARNAGTLAIGVAWGYHDTEELSEAGAQIVVHSYREIPRAAQDLMERG